MRLLLAAALCALAAPSAFAAKGSYQHYLKALLLQRQGLYDEALREYQAVVTIDPGSHYVLEQAAELALDLGQTELALEFADKLVAERPDSAKAHHMRGHVRWSQGEVEAARKSFEKALEVDPDFPEALYSMGSLLSASDPEGAKKHFLRYMETTPASEADIQYQLALLEQRTGDDEAAIGRLRRAVELEPSFLQARYGLAQAYEGRKDTASARAEYEALLPLDPGNVGLLVRLGELSFQRGDKEVSEAFFRKGAELEPGHPAARFWLALLSEERGDFKTAADELARSSALGEDPALSLRLSYYLTQAGRLEEAVGALFRSRTKWPDDPELAYFLGLGYDDLGRTDEAVAAMKDAARLKPDSREARFQLGALLEKLGRIEEAEREFRVLLSSRPDDAAALNYLGYSLADRGLKLSEAERFIQKAVALEPENGAYLDSLGWVRFKLGRFEPAVQAISSALKLVPDDAVIWEHLGDAQAALGLRGEAWLAWTLSARFGGALKKLGPKLEKAADELSADELGRLHLEYFRRTHDDFERLYSLCAVKGRVGPSSVSFDTLLVWSRPDGRLKLDVLGPLFVPLWSMSHDGAGADLGGMEAPGLPREAFEAATSKVLELVRGYFAGEPWGGAEARHKRGWRKSWVETPGFTIFFSKDPAPRLLSIRPKADRRFKLEFDAFRDVEKRQVPGRIGVDGPAFEVELELKRVSTGPSAEKQSPEE